MPENIPPYLDRLGLENQFGNYNPSPDVTPLPNIAHQGIDTPLPAIGPGDGVAESALTALERSILTPTGGDGKLRGGSIPRSVNESLSNRYDVFVPGNYDNEDAYAQGQGWTSKMVNGVGKGLLLTGTTFLQGTAGLVNGVAKSIEDGRAASFYDNEFNRAIDEINKKAEDALPNYYTNVEKNAHWYSPSKLLTGNFLWDGIVKNLGFAAGAALTGQVFSAALSAMPLTSRLFSVGKAAEALAATEEGLIGANKVAETFGKVKSLSDKLLGSYSVLNPGGRALVAGLSTTGEASFEAYNNLNEFRDKKIQEYKDANGGVEPIGEELDAINQAADGVGNASFLANVALLSATNYIQFPKILGSSYKAEKGMINSLVQDVDNIIEDAGKFVVKPRFTNKLLSGINKIRPYTFSTSEGFEEGAQYAIQVGTQDYYDKKYNNEPTSWISAMSTGITETIGTDEGMSNVLIGGLSGAIMQGPGRFRENKERTTNTAAAVQAFNKFRLSDFTKDTIDSVNRGTVLQEERETALKDGDILKSKDLEADYVINYLSPRIKYGRFDLVQAEINDYRTLASTEEGFAQLQAEGKALPNENRQDYLTRISSLQGTANNVKSLYQSLNLRYSGLINDKGERIYKPEVLDKMVYAASKVADYDDRLKKLMPTVVGAGIDLNTILKDILAGDSESFNEAITTIANMDVLDNVKEDVAQALEDMSEMTLLRQKYLKEYAEYKTAPEKYIEQDIDDIPITQGTVTVTTKDGEEDLEIGTEYFLGRVVDYSVTGKEVYRAPIIKILAENEDGTIKVQASNGSIKDISKAELEDYKLGKVEDTLNNKKAKFFMDHWNTVYEFNFGKGNKKIGRLEYSPNKGILLFKYKDGKGETKEIEVTGDQFVAKKGFAQPMIKSVQELTAVQQKSLEEFTAEQDERTTAKRESRLKILNELFDETFTRQEKIDKLILQKQSEIANITEQLTKLEEQIANAQVDKRSAKTIMFKSVTTKALHNAMRLNRMVEQLENQIQQLQSEREEIEFNMTYISDMVESIDELPTDSKDFLEELNDQVLNLEILHEAIGQEINALSKLLKAAENALQTVIDFISDMIGKFEARYPEVPRFMGQDWADFIKANPNFLKIKPNYKEELQSLEDVIAVAEDETITPDEKRIGEIKEHLSIVQDELKEVEMKIKAATVVLDKFQEVADKYKNEILEEQRLQADKKLLKQFLGTMDNSVPNTINTDNYEAASKKDALTVVGSTIATNDPKEHHLRANRFGFRIEKFPNRKSIRGIVVTSKTEDSILPGLTEHLIGDSGLDKNDVIALVMVQENKDGSYNLVDEFGKPLAQDADSINTAIYQVFPAAKLEATYDGKKETMFRENTPEYVEESLRQQYKEWREAQLSNDELGSPQNINASFGIPQYVTYTNEKGNEVRDYDARTSAVDSGLITENTLSEEPVMVVATTNDNVTNGSVTFRTPKGRVFLQIPGGLAKLFNRKFTSKEANTIFDVIHQLTKNAEADRTLKTEKSQRLISWLKSVTYWGIIKDADGKRKAPGYNSIWFEDVDDGGGRMVTKLFISGKEEGFNFTPQALENRKADIILLLENMYNNANSSLVNSKSYTNPYYEIVGIDANGEPITKKWNNYQTFLLSSEGRNSDEIPFTTQFRPIENDEDTNREGIYFTLNNTVEEFIIPEAKPVVKKATPTSQPVTKDTAPVVVPQANKAFADGPVLDGETKNTRTIGTYGDVTYTFDKEEAVKELKKADADTLSDPEKKTKFIIHLIGKGIYIITAPKPVVDGVRAAKNVDEPKANSIIATVTFNDFASDLIAETIPVNAPIVVAEEATPTQPVAKGERKIISSELAGQGTAYEVEAITPEGKQILISYDGARGSFRVSTEYDAESGTYKPGVIRSQAEDEKVAVLYLGQELVDQLKTWTTEGNKGTPEGFIERGKIADKLEKMQPVPFTSSSPSTGYNPEVVEILSRDYNVQTPEEALETLITGAIAITEKEGYASASGLQRILKIGYNRAGRYLEILEKLGIIGGFEGNKAREVIFNDPELIRSIITAAVTEKPSIGGVKKSAFRNRQRGNEAPDDTAYRKQLVKEAKKFQGENWAKVEAFLKANFPNVPVYRVKNIIQATNGKQAWGMLHNGAIYLYENAETGTAYHEVFEAVWKMFADAKEKSDVIKEFRNRTGSYEDRFTGKEIKYSEASEADLKEELAEEFRDYILYNKSPKREKGNVISRLFYDMVKFFKEFFTGKAAINNTEKLFSQIGNGYYKEYNPFVSKLSYANRGIIDIDNATADSSSELRVIGIPAVQLHEIIQHMTFSTLRELVKNNQSLFSITPTTVSKAQLKKDVLDVIGHQGDLIEEAILKKELTQKEADDKYNKIEDLYNNVEESWDTIFDKFKTYLKTFNIEFDENNELIVNDENNSGKSDYQDARKIDNFRRSNSAIKLLIASLPESEVKQENGKDKVKIVRSSIGGATLVPSDKVFINLMNQLHDSVDIEDMFARLRTMALGNPNYANLYKRITKVSPTTPVDFSKMDENDLQLISSFWKAFKRQNADAISVFVLPSGEVVISDSTLSSGAKQEKRDMLNSIVDTIKSGTPLFTYDYKTGKYTATEKVNKIKLNGAQLSTYTSFLNQLGIDFNLEDLEKLKANRGNQLNIFRKAVEGIQNSLSNVEDVSILSTTSLDIDGRLLELGTIRAILENPEFESTYFNMNGERTQTFIGTNALSTMYDTLSKLSNISEVEGTNYQYLLTDVFSQGSVMLNKMFNIGKSGNRIAGSEDFMKPVYIDGTNNEATGKKKESSKLTYKERLVQEINLNSDGYYMNLVPGDASIEWAVNMHTPESPFITEEMFANDDYFDIFKNYFISEVGLARDDRKVSKGKNSKDLRFFKSILGTELHDKIMAKTNSKLSEEELYAKYHKEINKAVKDYIKNESAETENLLRKFGIVEYTEEGLVAENLSFSEKVELTEEILKTKLNVLSANYIVANIELHKLLYSDPFQYSDELKRIKNFNSPRQPLIHGSIKINSVFNKIYNKGFKIGDIGYTDMTRDFFRTAVIEDVLSYSDLQDYDPFEETDGGGYITLKGNRIYGLRAGDWTSANERQYRYDVAYEKNVKGLPMTEEEKTILAGPNPNVKSTYTPRKPIVSGNKADGNNFNDVVLHKFALVPLSFRILHQMNPDSNAVKFYNKLQNEDIDYVVYNSGAKVGAGVPTPLYDEEGAFNTSSMNEINNIPFSIMGVQAEIPSKDLPQVTQGSQITKLATLDFMEAGIPIDYNSADTFENRFIAWAKLDEDQRLKSSDIYKEIKNNQNLLEARIEEGFETLIKRLGLEKTKEVINGKTVYGFKISDVDKLITTLEDEILKREVNENITDAFGGFKSGDVVLEATPAYQQIRNILYSIADKNVVSPKISGGMKVQIPSTLLETNKVKAVTINGKKAYASDTLKFYEDEDGKRVCEVMLSRWFDSNLSDDALINMLNNTPEGKKILEGIGFRIPTQKQNSIDVFRVAKFLPREFGDSVVIPSALVKKVGSDFDIDKLSVYLKNVFKGLDNKLAVVPFYGYGNQAKEQFKKLYKDITAKKTSILARKIVKQGELKNLFESIIDGTADEDTTDKWIPIFKDWFANEEGGLVIDDVITEFYNRIQNLGLKFNELTDEELQEILANETADIWYKQSLENEYIQSLQNLVSHPLNFPNLIKPNSADQLKALSKEINNKLGNPEINYGDPGTMLNRSLMSNLRQSFVSGKYAIGIAAVSQTNHAQNQRSVVVIDRERLNGDKINDVDKKWLGDGIIKFKDFNSIDGKPTLSFIKNKAGEYISDIIGQFIDGYVDISKGPWIMEMGASPNVASTWLFLAKLGVPIKTVGYFMNQPIVKDYLRTIENNGYSWLFIDKFVDDMNDIYEPQEQLAVSEIPSEKALFDMIGKKSSELKPIQKAQQIFILEEFLKYSKMANHLFQVTQGSNFDTATINDPFLVFKKQQQLIKAQNTIISSVDDILEKSFVGILKEVIYDVRDAFSTILISDRDTNNSGGISMRGVMEAVLTPFIDLPDRQFVKTSQKAVNNLFDWAVQTDRNQNFYIRNILLGDDTEDSAAKQIINYKETVLSNPNHPLYNNLVINSIKSDTGVKEGKANNLYIAGRDNKVYDQNQIIYAFREIKEELATKNSKLYGKLVRLALLQSGLTNSPIAFTNLLPYEDFKTIYNETLSNLENIPNLEDFYTLHVFERNNWNDSDLVPFKKAKLLKSKAGNWYNPNIQFLSQKLKNKFNTKKDINVIAMSKFSPEGRSEFLVYSWEDAISKADRIKRRKKGDRSHVHKTLMQKVYAFNEKGEYGPLIQTSEYQGKIYENYIYKAINAWGDSFRAQEFYDSPQPSVLDNGFDKEKVELNDADIASVLNSTDTKEPKKKKENKPKDLPAIKRSDKNCNQ